MKFRGKLLPAERTLIITRAHPIKLIPVVGYTMVAVCAWSFASTTLTAPILFWLGTFISVVTALVAIRKLMVWLTRRYVITTHRLLIMNGRGVYIEQLGRRWIIQKQLGQWLGYGAVHLELMGTIIPLAYVPKPDRFVQFLDHSVNAYRPMRAGHPPMF